MEASVWDGDDEKYSWRPEKSLERFEVLDPWQCLTPAPTPVPQPDLSYEKTEIELLKEEMKQIGQVEETLDLNALHATAEQEELLEKVLNLQKKIKGFSLIS
jgi:hypothetical protein